LVLLMFLGILMVQGGRMTQKKPTCMHNDFTTGESRHSQSHGLPNFCLPFSSYYKA
jgi:hypothetical protein